MTTLGVDSEFRQLPPMYGWRIPPQEEEALRISYWILLDILAWSTAKQDIGFLYLTTLTALSPAEKYWTVPPSAFYDDCEQKNCSYIETYKFYVAWLLPNSQQQEEELPELSASSAVQTGGQDVEESRPAVVLVRGRKRGSGVHLRSPRTKRVKQMPAKFVD